MTNKNSKNMYYVSLLTYEVESQDYKCTKDHTAVESLIVRDYIWQAV